MFTVVMTEQEYLDDIEEYKLFLQPFLEKTHIAFCCWRPDGQNLQEAAPELYSKVARHEQWRLIVVCGGEGMEKKNPFNVIEYADPERSEDQTDSDYRQLRQKLKTEAYQKAAQQPLVKLMTWLCQPPLVTEGTTNPEKYDPEFAEYIALSQTKDALRREINAGHKLEISYPSEIICVAKRCREQSEQESYDIHNSWVIHHDIQYSRFYDWNMYFDKMRYLVFDVLPKNHQNYTFDRIRFLYALMLLAEHETPMAVLSPNRLYSLTCQNDEAALSAYLGNFDAKLSNTKKLIQGQIRKIEEKERPRLSDEDAQSIFCSGVTVPVTLVRDFDQSTLFVPGRGIGLAGDCPQSENVAWESGFMGSRRALSKYLKTPNRALRKTTGEMRWMNTADLRDAGSLNDFQLEDVSDYVAEEELRMVNTETCDLANPQRYFEQLEESNKAVRKVIERRMTRKWTITLGIVALVCYLTGFIPMFISNFKAENGTLFSLLFILIGTAVLALGAFVTLFFLRYPLKKAYSNYNGTMKGVVNEVDGSLSQYSKYLSHACNVMRGYSVLNYCQETEEPDAAKIRILKKHEMDIRCLQEEFREIFAMFLPEAAAEPDPTNCFNYDFSRPVDFEYPMPRSPKAHIDFMQKGNLVEVPVDFVKDICVRREDLYDQ